MTDMICTCSSEGQFEAESARLAIASRLGVVEAMSLAQALWRSIQDDFGATVRVASDQWFGVWAEAGDTKVRIECDDPLDGLIFAWNRLAEDFPERVPAPPVRVSAALRELSVRQLRECDEAEAAYVAHREACTPACKAWSPPCEVGKAMSARRVAAHHALIDKWGEPLPGDKKAFYGIEEEEAGEDSPPFAP